MKKIDRVKFIIQYLEELYPKTPIPLNHKNHFELLIAVLLSAQCTDERVNKVTPTLFSLANTPYKMTKLELEKRSIKQKIGIKKRFPQLPDDIIQSTWSGIVSRTRNSSQIFEKLDDNIFVAGCYNGSGIGVGTLFGEQIAIKASKESTNEIETIEARNKPTWLPPQPFLDLGVKVRLIYERLRARSEI